MNRYEIRMIFRQLPHNYFIMNIDAPKYTIIGATDIHLKSIGVTREQIIGKGTFDMFPDNPDNHYKNSEKLLKSFERVIATKVAHQMETVRYDIFDKDAGIFKKKYWAVLNTPYIENGKVKFIINNATDLTALQESGIFDIKP